MTEPEIKQIVELITSSIVEPIKEYIDTMVDKKLTEHKINSPTNLTEDIKSSFKKELFGNDAVSSSNASNALAGLFGDDIAEAMSTSAPSSPSQYYENPMAEVLKLAKSADKLNETVVQKESTTLESIANQDFSKFL